MPVDKKGKVTLADWLQTKKNAVKMTEPSYHVWINDDDKYRIKIVETFLQKKYQGALTIRKHESYSDLTDTLIKGGYIEWSSAENQGSEEIPPPDLVIQDYVFSRMYYAGRKSCRRALKDITEHFPSAKVVISTTEENFEEVQKMLKENGWQFPVTGKVSRTRGNPVIEEIITKNLKQHEYTLRN